jgi:hypothetical protein
MAKRASKLVDRFEAVATTLESQQKSLAKTIRELKPTFWQSTIREIITSLLTIGATLGGVILTSTLATKHAHQNALATAAAEKETESAQDVKVRMTDAVEAFRGFFGTIVNDPTSKVDGSLKAKAVSLRDAVYSSMLPLPQQDCVSKVFSSCINGFKHVTEEQDPEKRRTIANQAITDMVEKRQKADESIESWLYGKK